MKIHMHDEDIHMHHEDIHMQLRGKPYKCVHTLQKDKHIINMFSSPVKVTFIKLLKKKQYIRLQTREQAKHQIDK